MSDITINWFEIPVADLDRAARFYGDILGTELGDMEGPAGPMKTFQNGEMPVGALVNSDHNNPATTGPLLYIGTDDIDAVLDKVSAAGALVLLTKTSIGAYGSIAQFIDSEGNRIALHSH